MSSVPKKNSDYLYTIGVLGNPNNHTDTMDIQLEAPDESRDFGERPTLRITAMTPADLFKLGRESGIMEEMEAEYVIGTTADATGKYLRIPLSLAIPEPPQGGTTKRRTRN